MDGLLWLFLFVMAVAVLGVCLWIGYLVLFALFAAFWPVLELVAELINPIIPAMRRWIQRVRA